VIAVPLPAQCNITKIFCKILGAFFASQKMRSDEKPPVSISILQEEALYTYHDGRNLRTIEKEPLPSKTRDGPL
jgi:hypothetical protein